MKYKQIIKTALKIHWLIIFGIILIAIGAFVTLWVRIIITAVGTFLMYFGGYLQSNKVSDEIKDKLKSTNEKIDSLKKDPGTNSKTINEIDNEFNSWAKDFINKKNEYQLNFEQQDLDVQKKKNKLSNEWGPLYDYFFKTLKNMLEAYNINNDNKIKYYIPDVPSNLYSEELKSSISKIEFTKDVIWFIGLKSYDSNSIPEILIDNQVAKSNYYKSGSTINLSVILSAGLNISPKLYSNLIQVWVSERDYPVLNINGSYVSKDYKNSIKKILKTILEYQLIIIDKNRGN